MMAGRPQFGVRVATTEDLPALGKLGGMMVRTHHDLDPRRFILPDDVEAGYAWWLGKELRNRRARVLVVCGPRGRVVGYAYARVESRDWQALRDKCVMLHDILVLPEARRQGAAALLLDAVLAWARERKSPRVVLHTAWQNEGAQALFRGRGFRPTMIEMTCEL